MNVTPVDPTIRPHSSGVSRRTLLAGMAGGLLTALALGSDPAVAKKRGKGKGKGQNPEINPSTTVNETVTEIVNKTETRTFTNPTPIIPNFLSTPVPVPALIRVAGFIGATITDVDLVLVGLGHARPADLDMLLIAPDGRNAIVWSDVGGSVEVSGLQVRLDDEAATPLPDGPLASGAFQPRNFDDIHGPDSFGSPGLISSGATALSIFDGMDPNGEWRLFIHDDHKTKGGSIEGGWELRITATVPTTVTRTTTQTIPSTATGKAKPKKKKR